jgi:tetratricopeptide (TPR) repeat protein
MLERDPLYRPAINNLIVRYSVMGQTEKAREVLERARSFSLDDYFLLNLESGILNQEGRGGDALPLARAAWEQYPNDSSSRFLYALTLFGLRDLQGVLELNGNEFRVAALNALGRTEEATLLAYKLAASGEDVGAVFHLLGRSGRHSELVEFFEARWSGLAEWKTEYPSRAGFGDLQLALMAHAYRSVGNGERFAEAMRLLEENLSAQRNEGADNIVLLESEAYFHMLAGDEQQALDRLSRGVEGGFLCSPRITDDLPVFRPLEGDPRFEAIQQRNLEIINRERAKRGWEPVELDRAS